MGSDTRMTPVFLLQNEKGGPKDYFKIPYSVLQTPHTAGCGKMIPANKPKMGSWIILNMLMP